MPRQLVRLTLFALVSTAGVLIAGAAEPPPGFGPHDMLLPERDLEAYWLPRHQAQLGRQRRVSNLVPEAAGRATEFLPPKRLSKDLLPPPPAELPTAQAETQAEPHLGVDPDNSDNLLAAWQEHRFRDGGARALGFAFSGDGGRNWTEGRIPGITTVDGGPWDRASDPWVAYGPDGVAYLNSLVVTHDTFFGPNAILVSRSEDGGATWAGPVEVFRSNGNFNDKNAMVVDNSSSRHRGNVYVGWDINVAATGFGTQRLVVARSTDGGRSFRRPRRIHEGSVNIGVIPLVGPAGTVYLMWASGEFDDPNLSILFSRSTNGGRRWSRPRKLADLLSTGAQGQRSGVFLPSFAIDPIDGTLYVAWADSRFTGTDQATLSVSHDGGSTWSDPAQVSDGDSIGGSAVFTVGVTARPGGAVLVGYYTQTRNLNNGYAVRTSADHGASFGPGMRLDRKSFCGCAAAQTDPGRWFFGDYVGLASDADRFLALFVATPNRSRLGNRKQPDVFFARSR